MNQQNPPDERGEVVFSLANGHHGWMNLHSPHGFEYLGLQWKCAAEAWYSMVYSVSEHEFNQGHYATRQANMPEADKLKHLDGIMEAKIKHHPILGDFLLDLGDDDIIYSVSKYASHDQKWLGVVEENDQGQNRLGEAWMKIRNQLQSQQQ